MQDDKNFNNSSTNDANRSSSSSSTTKKSTISSSQSHRNNLIQQDNRQKRHVVTVHNLIDCKLDNKAPNARVKKLAAFKNRTYVDKLSCATNVTFNLECSSEFTPEELFNGSGLNGALQKLVTNSTEFKKLSQFGGSLKSKGYIVSTTCVGYGGDSPFQLLFGMKTCNDSIVLLDKFSKPGTISSTILQSAKNQTGCHLIIPSFNTRGFDYTNSIQRGILNSLKISPTNNNNSSSSSSSSSTTNNNSNNSSSFGMKQRNVINLTNPIHLNNIGENLQRLYNLFADVDSNSLNNSMMKFSLKENSNTSMVVEHSLLGFAIKSRPDIRLAYCQPSKVEYSKTDDRFLCVDQPIIKQEYQNIMENCKVVRELGCHNIPSIQCTILPNQKWIFKDGNYYHPKHKSKYKIPKNEKFSVHFNLKIVATFYKPTTSALPIVPFSQGIYPTPLWRYKDIDISGGYVRKGASPLVQDISTQDRQVTAKISQYKQVMNKQMSVSNDSTSSTVNKRNFSSSSSSNNNNNINSSSTGQSMIDDRK